ncbi:pyruvate, phosphate dikinase [Spiractinospora alimapuensis]|nr:pyruvate, phosphate dikinase [Spiractinospora alimapuensis]
MDLADADPATAGGKAAPLAELTRAGFDVPRGFVVPAGVYRAAAAALGIAELSVDHAAEARARVRDFRLPNEVVDDVSLALERLTDGATTDRVAVRSSSITEDGREASAAGQHDSVLAVRGAERVCEAILECWASLWTKRAVGYRARQASRDPDPNAFATAVLVQRFVDADVSGVMFTGAASVIEASWGVGEPIVAGQVTPDSWRVGDSGILERRPGVKTERADRDDARLVTRPVVVPERTRLSLTDAEVLRLRALGDQVSTTLGGPRDIEWASTADTTWLLQARPVTVPVPDSTARPHQPAGPTALTGVPASPGTASGPVRVVRGPADFPRVRPGDVLVCRATDPAWTPLFMVASAVVTETGGVLSHAAIVAREVGIPAVLAVPEATQLLTTSSTATVDGHTGEVTTDSQAPGAV